MSKFRMRVVAAVLALIAIPTTGAVIASAHSGSAQAGGVLCVANRCTH